jgi:uncharacterized protein YijF (DUF1287 family)
MQCFPKIATRFYDGAYQRIARPNGDVDVARDRRGNGLSG